MIHIFEAPSAVPSDEGGRRFKSCHSDQQYGPHFCTSLKRPTPRCSGCVVIVHGDRGPNFFGAGSAHARTGAKTILLSQPDMQPRT